MNNSDRNFRTVAWIMAAVMLYLTLALHLLPALLAGLLVNTLVLALSPRLEHRLTGQGAALVSAIAIAVVVIAAVTGAIFGLVVFFQSDAGSLPHLFARLADIVEKARAAMPAWIVDSIPGSTEAVHDSVVTWLKEHSREVQGIGKEAGRGIAHIGVGMVVGALIAVAATADERDKKPLAAAMKERVSRLSLAFRRIVFAQVQISAINTFLTAIFLEAVLPVFDIHLPLTKTLIVATFLAGLLPVVGNLISNTLIVVVGLSVSLEAGLIALAFLVLVHKLEYFLNAKIVGNRIAAHAWELLLAMLVLEAAFGLAGVVAAPIFYAYAKDELVGAGWV